MALHDFSRAAFVSKKLKLKLIQYPINNSIEKGLIMEEFEEKFIKPIINASYPGTLAALSLTVLQVTGLSGTTATPLLLKLTLLTGATTFLLSAFSIFFYSIYPTRKRLWTSAAMMFLVGLFCLITSVLLLFTI